MRYLIHKQKIYDIQCPKQAYELVAEIKSLFASGELSEAEKDAVMQALQQAYWDSKKDK